MMPAVAALSAGFAAAAFVPMSRPQGAIGTPTAAVSLFGMVPAVWADEADDEFKQIQKSVSPESEEFSQLQAPTITDPFPVKLSDFIGEAKKALDQGDIMGALRLLDDTLDESVDRTTNFVESDEPPWTAIGVVFLFFVVLANLIAFFAPIFGYFFQQLTAKNQVDPAPEQNAALQLRRKIVPPTLDGGVDLSLPPRESEVDPMEEEKEVVADISGKKKRPPVPPIPPDEKPETPAWMRKSA